MVLESFHEEIHPKGFNSWFTNRLQYSSCMGYGYQLRPSHLMWNWKPAKGVDPIGMVLQLHHIEWSNYGRRQCLLCKNRMQQSIRLLCCLLERWTDQIKWIRDRPATPTCALGEHQNKHRGSNSFERCSLSSNNHVMMMDLDPLASLIKPFARWGTTPCLLALTLCKLSK